MAEVSRDELDSFGLVTAGFDQSLEAETLESLSDSAAVPA